MTVSRFKRLSDDASKKVCLWFLRDLVEHKCTYHLEDDPAMIYEGLSDKPTFNSCEVDIVRHNVARCYEVLNDKKFCPIHYMMKFEEKKNAG